MIFNVSKNKEYRSQRKTKRRPASACNVTVATMGCIITGNEFKKTDGLMPEDYLMDMLGTKDAWALLNSKLPGAICNPWNTSFCIAWAVNQAVGKRICRVEEVSLQEMVHHVLEGGAVGVGGKFTKSGHFVCVVGLDTEQDIDTINNADDVDLSKIRNIIIDDPWGDYTKNYKDINGNDVLLPVSVFENVVFGKNKIKTAQMYYPAEVA